MSRSLQAFIYKIRLCYPFQRSQHTARGKHAGLRSTEPVELQQSPAGGIKVKLRTGFRSQNRSRTGRGNFAIDRIVHGARLRLRRNDTNTTGRSSQCRNRQCQRVRSTCPNEAKQPSCTCWRRHLSSRSTTLTRTGSSNRATCGSLKAICPFSPMPRQTISTGDIRPTTPNIVHTPPGDQPPVRRGRKPARTANGQTAAHAGNCRIPAVHRLPTRCIRPYGTR